MQHLKSAAKQQIGETRKKCNSDDHRQWRKQGGAVGTAASRMRAAAKQTLGAATRLSEAASFFPFRLPHRDYQGRAALDSCLPVLAALNTRHLLRKPDCRLKSPTGAFMASPPPSLSKRLFWFSFGAQKRTYSRYKYCSSFSLLSSSKSCSFCISLFAPGAASG